MNYATAKRNEITKVVTAEQKIVQSENYLQFRREAANGSSVDLESRVYQEAANGNLTSEQAEKILNRAEKFTVEKVSPGYRALESNVTRLVKSEDMYYDPRTDTAGFRSALPPDELRSIDEENARRGRSPETNRMLAVQSIMLEAERWRSRPENKVKGYNEFLLDFSDTMGYKEGLKANIVGEIQAMMTVPIWKDVPFTPTYGEYRNYGEAQEPAKQPRAVVKRANGMSIVQRPQGEQAQVPANISIEEYALRPFEVPDKAMEPYVSKVKSLNLSTDGYLALQFLMSARPNVVTYSSAELSRWITQVAQTKRFEEWKRSLPVSQ